MAGSSLQKVTILGSTGSIGVSTLDVLSRHSDRFDVLALTANSNVALMAEQCRRFKPRFAVLRDTKAAEVLNSELAETGTTVLFGDDGLMQIAGLPEADVVMAAIVGGAGLQPTLRAVEAGKRVLLANKESLVMSGQLFMKAVVDCGAELLPIDSEHNAIYQCLANGATGHAAGVSRILLTASGGPLLRKPLDELVDVTPDEACAHPNWEMGRKISVDSASMMNKGLELIEACHLFAVPPKKVDIVVHPQSIIHSMVEYLDGSIISQMGNPDMRTPIAHALAWPGRINSGVERLDVTKMADLQFEVADQERFPCLRLCREVAERGQCYAIALNAANEVAVERFLNELIAFPDIPLVIEVVLEQTSETEVHTIDAVLELDAIARQQAYQMHGKK